MFASFPVALLNPGPGGGGGGSGSITISVAPTLQTAADFSRSYLFPTPIAATVSGGVPSAYAWSFRNINGGTWAVFSGQGTATATALVSGVAQAGSAEAEMVCTATVSGVTYSAACTLYFENLDEPAARGGIQQ